ncbi:hypothetical protein CEUSTIGMA_g10888.t1 [Chlamydomonas eustigma]|uniref:Structural maintenance of chromosomes protein n=1 Tax=Chlamydomonas eustigma TaxID=1157962 RepID=A0A250XKA5_9CHLO|nr:hypothetical protein CEUSTIGMA_g10888.t1 [Chlamydomonas eustigma]|eukprot:GAX83463.1 hypothetical protein CEUSTIGMA_g10888.t1 [Chlamydomonas eustigma]
MKMLDHSTYQRSHGRIDCLEVENFKSYRGFQKIGPFKDFTAVIGPNGSGKSNLMDAISFVLGVRTNQLRGHQLKELLYTNSDGDTEQCKPRTGFVKLSYVTEGAETVVFSRHINPTSSEHDAAHQSVYKINNRTVTWEAYSSKLSSFGVLVKVRNFLVFQGDIEAVAAKSPLELTYLFEQVSGSDVFRKQYEELQQAQMRAEEKVALVVGKKRGILVEKRQKKEQKEEAEKYLEKQGNLKLLKADHVLFQLYHMQTEREAAKKALRRKEQDQEMAVDRLHAMDAEVEGLKKKYGGYIKEKLLKEKEVKKIQAQRDKKMPGLLSAKAEISRIAKRIKAGETEAEGLQNRVKEQKKQLSKLGKELEKVKETQCALEEEVEEHYNAHASEASRMGSAALTSEYQSIKAEAAAKTAKLTAERDSLAAQLQADEHALSSVVTAQQQLRERAKHVEARAAELRDRFKEGRHGEAEGRKEIKNKKAEITKLQEESRRSNSERQFLAAQLSDVERQLSDIRADRRENQREKNMAEAVEDMRRLLPGVHGRLTELGRVPQRGYQLALAVAMGRDVDDVVVDTDRVAQECIQYLRDKKLPPMTFIPLASCRVKPVNERLRSLGGTAKLAIDLIEFDPAFAKAFAYAFESTLVCDTAEEARTLAFGSGERNKVVSRDGTLMNRGGLITGGTTASHEARAQRWDDGALARLKDQQSELEQRLQALPSLQVNREREAVLAAEIPALEAKLNYAAAESRQADEKTKQLSQEAVQLHAEADKKQHEVDRFQAVVDERGGKVQALTTRINEVVDKLFASFSKRVGVANIREWEEQHAAFELSVAKRRAELLQQEAKLEGQLGYENGRNLAGQAEKRLADLEGDRQRLAELEVQMTAVEGELGELDTAMREVQERMEQLGTEVDKVEADLKEARRRSGKLSTDLSRMTQEAAKLQSQAEQACLKAKDLLASATLEQLDLPCKSKVAASGRRKGGNKISETGVSAMDVDGEEEGAGVTPSAAVASSSSGEDEVDAALDALDFTSLSVEQRCTQDQTARDSIVKVFQKDIAELSLELTSSAPNLKALDQYAAVKEKEKEQASALEDARREAQASAQAFDLIRQSRFQAFTTAFNHIAASINDIYQDLTRSTVHKLGGTAYLSMENEEVPFLHGIKYTAMPPTKRFRDMEQLSGGEKTLASLALLFAIHSYRPSPFFVLDEVDAALDATNVARVAHYIRSKTRRSQADPNAQPFQSIVISLKDIFYEKADALVGVARDGELACSRTFTFDLNMFEAPAADAEVV